MNYIELLVCMFVAVLVFSVAMTCYNAVLVHMGYIINRNQESLLEFHVVNYIRFDITRHAVSGATVKVGKIGRSSYISFVESIGGVKKYVQYRISDEILGKRTLTRTTEDYFYRALLNRRYFTVLSPLRFYESPDSRFIVLESKTYGDVLIPKLLPDVQVINISVRKVSNPVPQR